MAENNWNADKYIGGHSFVYQYGEDLLVLLAPRKGERILDLGCGTGDLADKISGSGALVEGVDRSEKMLQKARARFPHIPFARRDILELGYEDMFDGILSNAVLHWIDKEDQPLAAENIYRALKPGGRFVAEMGGHTNCDLIYNAVARALEKRGRKSSVGFYFPTIGQHTALLEQAGFRVTFAAHFARKTPLDGGEQGMENWISMFQSSLLDILAPQERRQVMDEILTELRQTWLYNREQKSWRADYVRLRFTAEKPV